MAPTPPPAACSLQHVLLDQKVSHLYMEFWIVHRIPEQFWAYINKSKAAGAPTAAPIMAVR
ncbi:MAG: hypothetical protein QW146_03090 [Candidatus Bathyarchaeia archaeon]